MRKIASVSSLMHAHVLTCAAVALSFIFKASGASFTYNDLTVEYTNASLVWMGEEPALVYSNATVQGTLVLPGKAQVRMLLVGGGGAGGTSTGTTGNSNGIGGGGGAGGFLETNDVTLAAGTYTITVGAGGAKYTGGETMQVGSNGASSIFVDASATISFEAFGGGGGGVRAPGSNGASGGGGSRSGTVTQYGGKPFDASGTPIDAQEGAQGFSGGDGTATKGAGGGGGAGGIGGNSSAAAQNGGDGKISYILSDDGIYYAGGGGGGRYSGTQATGGLGGGGSGGVALATPASDGLDGFGGGGGGGGRLDPGGKGGDGIVVVRLTQLVDTLANPPEKPAEAKDVEGVWEIEWDNAEHIIYPETSLSYTLLGTSREKDPGEYSFTATLVEGFTWKGKTGAEATAPITVDWRIAQATNYIQNLYIKRWEVGALPNVPTCEKRYGTVNYSYRLKSDEDIEANYSSTPPSTEGEYVLRAKIAEDPRWEGAEAKCEFIVFTGALDTYTDYVTIKVTPDSGATLPVENLPVRVVLRENDPFGFSHDSCIVDGVNTLRFYDGDTGEPLAYSNETWNVNGESVYWVKVPSIGAGGADIVAYWGLKEGKTPVPVDETATWEAYTPEQAAANQGVVESLVFGLVTNAAEHKSYNYFTVLPAMSKTDWYLEDVPQGEITRVGTLADGAVVTNWFSNRYTGEIYDEMPTVAGAYKVTFTAADMTYYYPFEYSIEFMIRDRSPETGIGGNNGDSGRVLLMNDDLNEDCPVSNQGYSNTSMGNSTWWDFDATDDSFVPAASSYPNLRVGYQFYLRKMGGDGEILWNLVNCRQGNTYRDSSIETGTVGSENYLPWNPESRRITTPQRVGNRPDFTGTLVMRNMVRAADGSDGACIYSKCFDDGIGTIYFDVVNQATNATAETCALKVMIAKTDIYGGEPTDRNVQLTNGYILAKWESAPAYVLKHEGEGAMALDQSGVEEIALTIKRGGSTNNFYRVYVPVNYTGPVRFKIERTKKGLAASDLGDFIILDNIIVSVSPMHAELVPYGTNDVTKIGKQLTGWAGAWTVPFPGAADELYARGKVSAYTNSLAEVTDIAKLVTSAKMHYRWRYLEQRAKPAFGAQWYSVELNPGSGFTAFQPLDLPGTVGDVEFYFTGTVQAPYYKYVDYSGTGLGVPGYSEEQTDFKSGWSGAFQTNPKARADWFVRLREGESNYESLKVEYRFRGAGAVYTNDMEIVKNHTWRGYVQTPTNSVGRFDYRVLAVNLQENGAEEYAYNCEPWVDQLGTNEVPVSGSLEVAAGEESWSTITNDAKTGYLMFQVDDRTKGLTIVHADYQDFNKWNDAAANSKQLFVGRSDNGDDRVGVSAEQRTCIETFDSWLDMPAFSQYWTLTFPTGSQFRAEAGYPPYETFAKNTYNGWDINQGMWVAQEYRDVSKGAALQMEGCGRGGFEYVQSPAPRGIDSISFNARLGQSIAFENFCYYDAGARERQLMSNCTFSARVAFDGKNNEAFRGNASLSLIAHYVPGRGCYEARWEQIGEHPKKSGNYDSSANNTMGNKGQRLCIYRWNADPVSGKYVAAEIAAWTNTVVSLQKRNTTAGDDFQNDETAALDRRKYLPFYISITNKASSVVVTAGVRLGRAAISGSASEDDFTNTGGSYWYNLQKEDTNAKRLTSGTYGLLAANCEGVFFAPVYRDTAAVLSGTYKAGTAMKVTFGPSYRLCKDDIFDNYWYYQYGRMEPYTGGSVVATDYGFRASPVSQKLYVSLRSPAAGGSEGGWSTIWTNEFNSFGTSSSTLDFSTNLYSLADSQIRFEVGGDVDDVRVDVVVDDVRISQWRGDGWANAGAYVNGGINSIGNNYYDLTNFTFSTAWIKEKGILLSAKRTTPSAPASIKSPLFDDAYGRGSGLGKFTFSYSNAQENASLLLQIATNVNYTQASAANLDQFSDELWYTVSNFNFSVLSAEERVEGSRTVYTGLHGVSGMFRLVVDPAVVEAVADNISDTSRFGEVLITEVSCTDEPSIDERAWWGWNIRSVGQDAELKDIDWQIWNGQDGCNAEGRTYLPDFSENGTYAGRSMALNNSYVNPPAKILPDGVTTGEEIVYNRHRPFVQSPTFTDDIVGEVSFKARKFKTTAGSKPALLVLYGARKGHTTDADDSSWQRVQDFSITNDAFETYTYKTPPGGTYNAFRLAVPLGEEDPQRVIIDEFLVCEAVRPNLKFRNVGAFRSNISGSAFVPGVPSKGEQPLCNESWGVQCELYASQLADEVDFTAREPKVYLSWFKGPLPWGYDAWKVLPGAKRVQLPAASDSNLVFRSTNLGRGDSVIPASTTAGEVVQYMLEVVYYNKSDLTTPVTNRLDESMWRVPGWFSPLDYNRNPPDDGLGGFAAFNVLDTVAPGWAWINEVNIYSMFDAVTDENVEDTCQYVEIAAPVEAALDGWELKFLERADDTVVTNIAATFGTENLPAIKDAAYSASNMSFHVVASPLTNNKKELKRSNGTLDGVWSVSPTRIFGNNGAMSTIYPFAVQLVRPSGIIEHEITVSGTNLWAQYQGYAEMGDVFREAGMLNDIVNAAGRNSNIFGVGYDNGPTDASLGVFESQGEDAGKWNNTMLKSPGRINVGQQIDSNHPVPHGEEIFIYANLDPALPHIRQTFGDVVNSNANTFIVFQKGRPYGTNITYTVDPWYVLGSVTTNGKAAAFTELGEPRTYSVEVGKGVSNNVTVLASAAISPHLVDVGLDPNDRYTPAILDWLEKGTDIYGRAWPNAGSETISLAQVVNMGGSVITNLSLREMYWLDIDPTLGDMFVRVGWGAAPIRKDAFDPSYAGTRTASNVVMSVYMCISNDNASTGYKYWPPYVIRGMEPGSHSLDYTDRGGWTDATFKIRGILANGKTDLRWLSRYWVPLRWFVFNGDSFYPAGHEKECQARIEIVDPRSSESQGYSAGWDEYDPSMPIYFSWMIDTQMQMREVEMLRKENLDE